MPVAGPVAYASVSDLFGTGGYLRDPSSSQNNAIATILLNVASRFIDEKCGRFFYNDGNYQRFFDGLATREVTLWPDFFGKIGSITAVSAGATSLSFTVNSGPVPQNGDTVALDIGTLFEQVTINGAVTGSGPYTCPITATQFAHVNKTIASTMVVQFAYYENQPFSQWLTVQGDGLSGGSTNYMLWPTNPKPYLTSGSTQVTPWQGFNLPLIPVTGTTYLPTPRPGSRTMAITANWGWAAVPDLIRDLTLKMVARAWEHRQAGWAGDPGSAQVAGGVNMSHHFDSRDEDLLISSGFVRMAV